MMTSIVVIAKWDNGRGMPTPTRRCSGRRSYFPGQLEMGGRCRMCADNTDNKQEYQCARTAQSKEILNLSPAKVTRQGRA